ncbi:FtsW/RodA/SpoVE family cell cycle protein [Amedibacterium intestinale]|uniref:FtsW/RodA/SpoVE family cell cycle protein n=1 Tax=Amedibacterium intestinale TaxID=2583452 RepID=UPI000E4747BB|nr:FtsW/RodA/SpoVE family cell cycle protein [Amedibacterium intestinale]RHO21622.1 FtsW/RodA/SpoVE family cell cycle protein [Eubacterium sp. AM18-26]RHO25953.1 FtsW/RodA/SpoVE family cell cycle protein [Eubacterium sp. AM18-10LB-B]BBK62974.1 cell division protein FtsW [Amedibacterium intestinale]
MDLGSSKAKRPDKFDFVLIALLVLMMCTSLLSIAAASGIIGVSASTFYLVKQAAFFIGGFGVIAILHYIGNDSLFDFAKIGYWILMGCLVLCLIGHIYYRFTGAEKFLGFVSTVNGATSWFNFPVLGSFQPSEYMKIVLVIITANVIDEHNKNKSIDSFELDFNLFIKILKWALPPMILIFLQPDTGVCIIIAISIVAMVLCSGIKKEWIIFIGVFLLIAILIFVFLYVYHYDFLGKLVGGPYKLTRFNGWLHPEENVGGDGYHLYMALLAIGSSGLTGHGMGVNLVDIPEAQTDFIFAVIGQSWGLIGTVFIVILCAALDLYLCRIATACENMFEKYIVIGVLGILIYQQFQNIGMVIGLLPITGITLPLISYGGSSIISYMIAFGIIFNTSCKSKKHVE